jgi:hypothetical protein
VDVTTHLRARAAQAGALLALVGGIMAATASPAAAADPKINSVSVDNQVESGGRVSLSFTVSNDDDLTVPGQDTLDVKVNGGGLKCNSGCSTGGSLAGGADRDINATLTAPEVGAGQS